MFKIILGTLGILFLVSMLQIQIPDTRVYSKTIKINESHLLDHISINYLLFGNISFEVNKH